MEYDADTIMIAITGMHRSGTSCVTGLLDRCGLSLGTSHKVYTEPRPDNQKGHFENYTVLAVNEKILELAGGAWDRPPEPEAILSAGEQISQHITLFNDNFNGAIFKEPRICLTLPLWQRYCPNMTACVFCLRNPLGVALSLMKRNGFTLEKGIYLWMEYNIRFFAVTKNIPLFIFDYDNLRTDFRFEIGTLCRALGISLSVEEISDRTKDFFAAELNHDVSNDEDLTRLPTDVQRLYAVIKSQTFAGRLLKTG
jgi:hypothetical protein